MIFDVFALQSCVGSLVLSVSCKMVGGSAGGSAFAECHDTDCRNYHGMERQDMSIETCMLQAGSQLHQSPGAALILPFLLPAVALCLPRSYMF